MATNVPAQDMAPSRRSISRPGQTEIQTTLFLDYRTNVDFYPRWQSGFARRSHRPWWFGGNTTPPSPLPKPWLKPTMCQRPKAIFWKRDISRSTKRTDEIAFLVRNFLGRLNKSNG
jgi:hypothetical protein